MSFWTGLLENSLLIAGVKAFVVAVARFDGRCVVQGLGAELAFAGLRAETAGCERLEMLGEAETDGALAVEVLERDAFEEWMR